MRKDDLDLEIFVPIIACVFLFLWICLFINDLTIKDKLNLIGANIDEINTESRKVYLGIVTVKAYTNHQSECAGNPDLTASREPHKIGTVAISRDLEKDLMFGDEIYLEGLGNYKVNNRTSKEKIRQIEIFMFKEKRDEAIKFGKKKVHLYLVK